MFEKHTHRRKTNAGVRRRLDKTNKKESSRNIEEINRKKLIEDILKGRFKK